MPSDHRSEAVFYIMQIATGIEVNSEAYFPKLREYCPSAEGMQALDMITQFNCLVIFR